MSSLVIGNAVVDIAYRPSAPAPVRRVAACHRSYRGRGGKGLNQAVAARRGGADVGLIAPVGPDQAARRIGDVLAREDLDPAILVTVDAPTDELVIWIAEDSPALQQARCGR